MGSNPFVTVFERLTTSKKGIKRGHRMATSLNKKDDNNISKNEKAMLRTASRVLKGGSGF